MEYFDAFVRESVDLSVAKLQLEKFGAGSKDRDGWTPLHFACHPMYNTVDRFELVHLLLEAGANADAKNSDEDTPFHFLLLNDGLEAIRRELEWFAANADLNAKNSRNLTPLQRLLRRFDDDEITDLVMGRILDINHMEPATGSNILHIARARSFVRLSGTHAELLVKKNNSGQLPTDVEREYEARNASGQTALMLSLGTSSVKLASQILEKIRGKRRKLLVDTDMSGQNVLHYASSNRSSGMVDLLMRHELAAPLIASERAWNKRKEDGRTPLHVLCERHSEHVLEMITKGAKPDRKDKGGNNCLHVALQNWNCGAVRALHLHLPPNEFEKLSLGTNNAGSNALNLAATSRGQPDCLKVFLSDDTGFAPKWLDPEENNMLHLACKSGWDEGARILLQNPGFSAMVDAPNKSSASPLLLGLGNCRTVELMGKLLKASARVHMKDALGRDALDYALSNPRISSNDFLAQLVDLLLLHRVAPFQRIAKAVGRERMTRMRFVIHGGELPAGEEEQLQQKLSKRVQTLESEAAVLVEKNEILEDAKLKLSGVRDKLSQTNEKYKDEIKNLRSAKSNLLESVNELTRVNKECKLKLDELARAKGMTAEECDKKINERLSAVTKKKVQLENRIGLLESILVEARNCPNVRKYILKQMREETFFRKILRAMEDDKLAILNLIADHLTVVAIRVKKNEEMIVDFVKRIKILNARRKELITTIKERLKYEDLKKQIEEYMESMKFLSDAEMALASNVIVLERPTFVPLLQEYKRITELIDREEAKKKLMEKKKRSQIDIGKVEKEGKKLEKERIKLSNMLKIVIEHLTKLITSWLPRDKYESKNLDRMKEIITEYEQDKKLKFILTTKKTKGPTLFQLASKYEMDMSLKHPSVASVVGGFTKDVKLRKAVGRMVLHLKQFIVSKNVPDQTSRGELLQMVEEYRNSKKVEKEKVLKGIIKRKFFENVGMLGLNRFLEEYLSLMVEFDDKIYQNVSYSTSAEKRSLLIEYVCETLVDSVLKHFKSEGAEETLTVAIVGKSGSGKTRLWTDMTSKLSKSLWKFVSEEEFTIKKISTIGFYPSKNTGKDTFEKRSFVVEFDDSGDKKFAKKEPYEDNQSKLPITRINNRMEKLKDLYEGKRILLNFENLFNVLKDQRMEVVTRRDFEEFGGHLSTRCHIIKRIGMEHENKKYVLNFLVLAGGERTLRTSARESDAFRKTESELYPQLIHYLRKEETLKIPPSVTRPIYKELAESKLQLICCVWPQAETLFKFLHYKERTKKHLTEAQTYGLKTVEGLQVLTTAGMITLTDLPGILLGSSQ